MPAFVVGGEAEGCPIACVGSLLSRLKWIPCHVASLPAKSSFLSTYKEYQVGISVLCTFSFYAMPLQ